MDQRIEKTYNRLLVAFDELMTTNRYEDISVTLLCEKAGIRRTTFYKHFADKDEFFTFFLLSIRDDLVTAIGAAKVNDSLTSYLQQIIQQLIQYLIGHQALVSNILASNIADHMASIMCDIISRDITIHIKQSNLTSAELLASPEILSVFLAGGIVHSIRHWWDQEDIEITQADVSRMSEYLLTGENINLS